MNYSSNTFTVFKPEASAYIATSNNRLKIYDDSKVYLPNNAEFQIEFENESNMSILAKIKMNGKYISQSGLVLESHDHHFLERWLNENRKFIFNTFEVEDVEETEAQRERNGKVEIEFYRPIIKMQPPTWPVKRSQPFWPVYDTHTNPISGGYVNDSSATRQLLCDSNVSYTSANFSSTIQPASVETGRVEQGAESNQHFNSVNLDFENFPYKTMQYQILPESHKPKRTSEIRHYCSECGMRRRKNSWNFCPQCGNAM